MHNNSSEGYENLVTILSVSALVVMLGVSYKMIEQHSIPFVASTKPIKGYERPTKPGEKGTHKVPIVTSKIPGITPEKPVINKADYGHIKERFDQAVGLLHAKQYEYAITALNDILKIQTNVPEVYVNLGYAYIGLKDFKTAQGAFDKALSLKPDQANAYYGLAIAYEGANDLEPALGAMRSYIHLSDPDSQLVAKARAAIWEWEQKLGRNPQAPPPLEAGQQGLAPAATP